MFHYSGHLKTLSQKLRREMTPPEKILWYQFLKNLKPRWTRQKPLAGYIADFYCYERQIVIEVDGNIHESQREYDTIRDEILGGLGLTIIRIGAKEIYQNMSGVAEFLEKEFERLAG